MPQKTRFESVSLDVVRKVVAQEIEQARAKSEPDQETSVANLKQLEKLVAGKKTVSRNGHRRKI
jgi:uncharacterized protein HemX